MKKYLAIIISLSIFFLIQTSVLQAQPGCPHFSPGYLLQRFTHVFVGKVLEEKEPVNYESRFSVQMLENFKGMENESSAVVSNVFDGCGRRYSVGETYLVAAYKGENGVLFAWTFHEGWKNQREYIDILRWKESSPNTGIIVGTVLTDNYFHIFGYQKPPNLRNVYLQNEKEKIFKTTIEPDGHYGFYNLIPGKYTVYLNLPKGLKSRYTDGPYFKDIDVTTEQGRLLEFRILHNNLIKGKVINSSGELLDSVKVLLFYIDSTGSEFEIDRAKTDENGEYEFAELPPGKYVIFAYPFTERKPYYSYQFPFNTKSQLAPSYFPAVLQRDKAKVIDLKSGNSFGKADITLKNLAKREISGQIFYPDGTPAEEVEIVIYVFKKITNKLFLQNDEYEVITRSGADGNFYFEGIENTKYVIQAISTKPYKSVQIVRSDCVELSSRGVIKYLNIMLAERNQGCSDTGIDYSK
jgi:hypothetical protein